MEGLEEAQAARALIARCVAGDPQAARQFQETYGDLIYGFPQRVYRTAPEDAGDFYVFAFHEGRIFRRLRTFEGRAPLRAYLLGFVLDDLVLEWRRAIRKIDTVSIDEVSEMTLQQAGDGDMSGDAGDDAIDRQEMSALLARLDVNKVVVIKLLHAEDYELTPSELRYIAKTANRPLAEVTASVDALRASVRDRETALRAIEDNYESVQAWIQLYQRRLRHIAEDLSALQPNSAAAERLRREQEELERKIGRREQQREKLKAQARRRKVTAPYKDIASILNTTVGNIGSQISRLREELSRLSGGSFEGWGADRNAETHGNA